MVQDFAGSSVTRLAAPCVCRTLAPISRHRTLAWRPDGRGLALLALRSDTSSSLSKLLLLLVAWPEDRVGEAAFETVELDEGPDEDFAGLAPLWAPDSARLAVVQQPPSDIPLSSIYFVSAQRVVSDGRPEYGLASRLRDWRWHPASTCLAAHDSSNEVYFLGGTAPPVWQEWFELPWKWVSNVLWLPLLGPEALLALSRAAEARVLHCCTGWNHLELLNPVCDQQAHSASVGLYHVAWCQRVWEYGSMLGPNDVAVEVQLLGAVDGELTIAHTVRGSGPAGEHASFGWTAFSPDGQHLAWLQPAHAFYQLGDQYVLRVVHSGSGLLVAEQVLELDGSRAAGIVWSTSGHRLGIVCKRGQDEEVDRLIVLSFW